MTSEDFASSPFRGGFGLNVGIKIKERKEKKS
jgi:hypothetical protein